LPHQLLNKKKINSGLVKKKLPIVISDQAVSKIEEIRKNKKISEDYFLRIGVKPAGCGIGSYIIGFDHRTEKDEVFELSTIKIIVEKIQLMHLAGKSIDYGESAGEIGFIFS
jgi:iron-sulfur cluster assembly protein